MLHGHRSTLVRPTLSILPKDIWIIQSGITDIRTKDNATGYDPCYEIDTFRNESSRLAFTRRLKGVHL